MKIEIKQLAKLSPLNALNIDNLRELSVKSKLVSLDQGKVLFRQGDKDKNNFYLLSGEVEIIKNNQVVATLSANSDDAKHPIENQKPRTCTVKAKQKSVFLQVNSDLLDIMLTWDQTGSYHVDDLQDEDEPGDWMTKVLQTKAFLKIPPANIQKMFMKMESVSYNPGDKVIKQGDPGDFFYIITEGKAMVTRATEARPKGIKLADLGPGDSFGEEALISDSKRNATITMLTHGNLMRLSKEDFISLLAEPLLDWIEYPDAVKLLAKGTICIDVRLPSEYRKGHIKGAQSIPLVFLRMKLKTFSPAKNYLVYCDTGSRSSVAAHLMSEKGLEVKILKNGMQDVPEAALEHDD